MLGYTPFFFFFFLVHPDKIPMAYKIDEDIKI